jgi:molybdopterin/thiamine biosynthesis adenylyltransferase
MDCLDSFAARGGLEEIRREHGVPVVHAGIEGWFGQAALFPGGGAGYEAVYGPDYASRPPAGKPMMPPVVTAVAALEVQLLLEWAEEGYDREHPDALYIYDGKLHSLERIALDSPAQA